MLVFLDTETTGLSLDDDIWEFACILRDDMGNDTEVNFFIEHDASKMEFQPDPFYSDYMKRWPMAVAQDLVYTQEDAANKIRALTLGATIVGAVPNFDTERLGILLRRFKVQPGWHYHLVDVENLAAGWLAAATGMLKPPPWNSDDLSMCVGVNPEDFDRHTALGDCRWVRAQYDAVMQTKVPA
jgi:DNA polymerase III epsilon subunit-like protein